MLDQKLFLFQNHLVEDQIEKALNSEMVIE